MVRRVNVRRGIASTPSGRRCAPEPVICSCPVKNSQTLHHSECPLYMRVDLNRISPPEAPLPVLKLRRPEGLWKNAVKTDVDSSSPEDHMANISGLVDRYLSIGEVECALYWIDLDYSVKKDSGENLYAAMAEYVKNLARCREWDRLLSFLERRHVYLVHLYFAYFYVSALYHMKHYHAVIAAEVAHLVDLESPDLNFEQDSPLPLRQPSIPPTLLTDIELPTPEEKEMLDEKVEEMKLLAAFLHILAKTYIATENTTAAARFMWSAWLRDKTNMEAEELITRFNFPEGKRRQSQWDKFVDRRTFSSPCNDPRSLLTHAQTQYQRNNIRAAYEYTKIIMREYGNYRPALLLHIGCAFQLEDSQNLFLLAHQLVDRNPMDEFTWYAVGMYYFSIGNNGAAKNFMNKATLMNRSFGEGLVALGHILSADNEHEQALNYYLKALRLLDRQPDVCIFLGMEHCRSNNIKLAMDFMRDPLHTGADSARMNAYKEHERGCVHYAHKQFTLALATFLRALRAAHPDAVEKNGRYLRDQIMQMDRFWEPLLVNLAHTHRRLMEFTKAILLYECALVLNKNHEQTLIGLGMCYASQGDTLNAFSRLHKALTINPFNTSARQAIERLVHLSDDAEKPWMDHNPDDGFSVEEFLNEPLSDVHTRAIEIAQRGVVARKVQSGFGFAAGARRMSRRSSLRTPIRTSSAAVTPLSATLAGPSSGTLPPLDISPIPHLGEVESEEGEGEETGEVREMEGTPEEINDQEQEPMDTV